MLSRILATVTPSTIDYEEFLKMTQGDDELSPLISSPEQTLQLKKLRMPGETSEIYWDISTGTLRSYVSDVLRRKVFLSE